MLTLVPFWKNVGLGWPRCVYFLADMRGCISFAKVILCTKGSLKAKDAPESLGNLA